MAFSNLNDDSSSLPWDSIKLNEEELESFLGWIDTQSCPSDVHRRKHERYAYRCKGLVVSIDQGNYQSILTAPIRNISNGGMAFLHRAMVHVGRSCRLQIRTPANRWIHITGKVVRARYVTQGIYEIGVQFDEEIDATQFKQRPPAARKLNALEGSG